MPEMTLDLTDAQFQALCKQAALDGKTVSQLAQDAVHEAVSDRWVIPDTQAPVVPFRGLKSSKE